MSWHSEAVDVALGVAELGQVGLTRAIKHGRRAAHEDVGVLARRRQVLAWLGVGVRLGLG